MPRLICTYRQFIDIICDGYGFELHRHDGSSHRRYRGVVKGKVRFVDATPHSMHDEIPTGTLKAMIRQSGLPGKLFRR